jgi:hypothetical protein
LPWEPAPVFPASLALAEADVAGEAGGYLGVEELEGVGVILELLGCYLAYDP